MAEPLLVYIHIYSIILFRAIEEKFKLKIQWRGSCSGKHDKWNTQFEREPEKYLLESQEVGMNDRNMNGCALIWLYSWLLYSSVSFRRLSVKAGNWKAVSNQVQYRYIDIVTLYGTWKWMYIPWKIGFVLLTFLLSDYCEIKNSVRLLMKPSHHHFIFVYFGTVLIKCIKQDSN